MTSVFSLRKSAESVAVETVAKLLRNGSRHEADRPDVAQAAEHLAALGMVQITVAEYVRCVNHNDSDYRYAQNRACPGRIRVDDDVDEDGDCFHCPECGRTVYPRQKGRHRMIQVETKPEKVADFLEVILVKSGLQPKQVHPWVWRVDTPQGEAKLVVADYCSAEHVSRDWAANNRASYVVVDSAGCNQRFLPESWLRWIRLADIVCQPDAMGNLLSSAAATLPSLEVRASVPVYSATVRPVVLAERPLDEADAADKACAQTKQAWPDPQTQTTAKFWTTKDGTFCLSTKTQGRYDGKVEFHYVLDPTKQMAHKVYASTSNKMALAELIDQVYPKSKEKVRGDGAALGALLKTLRTLISDIRNKKLSPAGINPEILPSLDVEVTSNTTIGLRLAHARDMDAADDVDRDGDDHA